MSPASEQSCTIEDVLERLKRLPRAELWYESDDPGSVVARLGFTPEEGVKETDVFVHLGTLLEQGAVRKARRRIGKSQNGRQRRRTTFTVRN